MVMNVVKKYELVEWWEGQNQIPSQFYFRLGCYDAPEEALRQMSRMIKVHKWNASQLKVIETIMVGDTLGKKDDSRRIQEWARKEIFG